MFDAVRQPRAIAWLACALIAFQLGGVAAAGLFDEKPSPSGPPSARAGQPPVASSTLPPATQTPAQPAGPIAPTKLAIPTDEQIRDAQKQVKEIFGDRIDKAHSTVERSKLAAELLEIADGTGEAVSKFVLLQKSQEMAADANDPALAMRAHGDLAQSFDLAGARASVEFFQKLSKTLNNAVDAGPASATALGEAADALAIDQFETARQLLHLASAMSRRSNDKSLNDRIVQLNNSIGAIEAEHRRIAPMIVVLAKSPDNPQANAALGIYRCFFKQEWDAGLPLLCKGDDVSLKQIAQKEMAAPTNALADPANASAQLALADTWWSYAENQPVSQKSAIRLHASKWYAQCSSGLSGLMKVKADQRSADYLRSVAGATSGSIATAGASMPPPGTPRVSTAPPPVQTIQAGPVDFTSAQEIAAAVPMDLWPPVNPSSKELGRFFAATGPPFYHKTIKCELTMAGINTSARKTTLLLAEVPAGQFTLIMRLAFDADDPQIQGITKGQSLVILGLIGGGGDLSPKSMALNVQDCKILKRGLAPLGEPALEAMAKKPPELLSPITDALHADFKDLDSLLSAMPIDAIPRSPDDWSQITQRLKLSSACRKSFGSKTICCRVRVTSFDTLMRYITTVHTQPMPAGSGSVSLSLHVNDKDPLLAVLRPGDICSITGRLTNATSDKDGKIAVMADDCRIGN